MKGFHAGNIMRPGNALNCASIGEMVRACFDNCCKQLRGKDMLEKYKQNYVWPSLSISATAMNTL